MKFGVNNLTRLLCKILLICCLEIFPQIFCTSFRVGDHMGWAVTYIQFVHCSLDLGEGGKVNGAAVHRVLGKCRKMKVLNVTCFCFTRYLL